MIQEAKCILSYLFFYIFFYTCYRSQNVKVVFTFQSLIDTISFIEFLYATSQTKISIWVKILSFKIN